MIGGLSPGPASTDFSEGPQRQRNNRTWLGRTARRRTRRRSVGDGPEQVDDGQKPWVRRGVTVTDAGACVQMPYALTGMNAMGVPGMNPHGVTGHPGGPAIESGPAGREAF